MHGQGILHRDIKCLNLLLDADKQIKIADLGIATVSKSHCICISLLQAFSCSLCVSHV